MEQKNFKKPTRIRFGLLNILFTDQHLKPLYLIHVLIYYGCNFQLWFR